MNRVVRTRVCVGAVTVTVVCVAVTVTSAGVIVVVIDEVAVSRLDQSS